MSGYRDLKVYQEAHRLGLRIHGFSLKLPKFELYKTGSQIRRASKAISANIVEGYGRRRYRADYVSFLSMRKLPEMKPMNGLRILRIFMQTWPKTPKIF